MLKINVRLSPEALFQELGGEAVILDLASSTYFGLDTVGSRLWSLLESDADVDAACRVLLDEFDVTLPQLETDVAALLQQLAAAGLVALESSAR
jgi:hypothetical protein